MNGLALCSGGGGLEAGLHIAIPNYRTVCAVERQAYAAAAFVAWLEASGLGACPVWDDLATFDPVPWRDAVDIVSAGFPCQPYSNAGKGLGEYDPRDGWPHVIRIVRTLMPTVVVFENVAALLTRGYERIKRNLEGISYTVAEGIYSAAEVGAPHLRERLFVVGVLADSSRGYGPWRTRIERGSASGRATAGRAGQAVADAERCAISAGPERPGREARTDPDRCGKGAVVAHPQGDGRPEGGTEHEGQQGRSRVAICGTDNANTCSLVSPNEQGLERRCGHERTTDDAITSWPWPAGRGAVQYDWEKPRLVESGMGRAINGVGSGNEQLYLLGNGVVPVAAAMAVVDLWRKLVNQGAILAAGGGR